MHSSFVRKFVCRPLVYAKSPFVGMRNLFSCLFVFSRNAVSQKSPKFSQNGSRLFLFLFSRATENVSVSNCFFSRYGRNMNHKSFSCLFFHKKLRGIVRQAEVRKSANSVVTDSLSRATKRTVLQRFYPKLQNCLFIPAIAPNVSPVCVSCRLAGFRPLVIYI